MPRYKLRTLLILMAVGPPVTAWAWRERRLYLVEQKGTFYFSNGK